MHSATALRQRRLVERQGDIVSLSRKTRDRRCDGPKDRPQNQPSALRVRLQMLESIDGVSEAGASSWAAGATAVRQPSRRSPWSRATPPAMLPAH